MTMTIQGLERCRVGDPPGGHAAARGGARPQHPPRPNRPGPRGGPTPWIPGPRRRRAVQVASPGAVEARARAVPGRAHPVGGDVDVDHAQRGVLAAAGPGEGGGGGGRGRAGVLVRAARLAGAGAFAGRDGGGGEVGHHREAAPFRHKVSGWWWYGSKFRDEADGLGWVLGLFDKGGVLVGSREV